MKYKKELRKDYSKDLSDWISDQIKSILYSGKNLNTLLNIFNDNQVYKTLSKISKTEYKEAGWTPTKQVIWSLKHKQYKGAKRFVDVIDQKNVYSVISKKGNHKILPLLIDFSDFMKNKEKDYIKKIAKIFIKYEDDELLDNLQESLRDIWRQSNRREMQYQTTKNNLGTFLRLYS